MSDAAPPRRSWFGRLLRLSLLVAGPVAIAVLGGWLYLSGGRYVTTENAYVKAALITVSTEVSGHVTAVPVIDNQPVAAGDVLFRLDPGRYEVALARARAELSAARQRVQALKARLSTRGAERDAAMRDRDFLATERTRAERLGARGTISEQRLLEAERAHSRAEAAAEIARQAVAEALSELSGDPDLPPDRHPDVVAAQAALDRAALDLAAVTVRAPADAITANLSLQPGEYVEAGDPVLSLVATSGFWVEANLKETDLTHLRAGQTASLEIDAYPGVVWQGTVASLAPATGAEYALLPPQNASGNWVKVVQRVPVRLAIRPEPGAPPLRAGMSVAVSIDTGHERPMPAFVTAAQAWIRPE